MAYGEPRHFHGPLTRTQLALQTQYTRTGVVDLTNRKPYRTKALKIEAQELAERGEDGAWRSTAPVLYHKAPAVVRRDA